MVFGGPPCQGYSQIGTRLLDDPRNELYLQYVRILKTLRPRVFLMENVPNMLLLARGRFKREVLAGPGGGGLQQLRCRGGGGDGLRSAPVAEAGDLLRCSRRARS